jgi:hypothetical protein
MGQICDIQNLTIMFTTSERQGPDRLIESRFLHDDARGSVIYRSPVQCLRASGECRNGPFRPCRARRRHEYCGHEERVPDWREPRRANNHWTTVDFLLN